MLQQDEQPEDVGGCKLTPAYNLPSQYVLHTVGPALESEDAPLSHRHQRQLDQCYLSCLDTAEKHGDIASVAFCCISTGVFHFPADKAAVIAVRTVLTWLIQHPTAHIQLVVFNVFTERDEALYQRIFSDAVAELAAGKAELSVLSGDRVQPRTAWTFESIVQTARGIVSARPSLTLPFSRDLAQAVEWIRSADSLLMPPGLEPLPLRGWTTPQPPSSLNSSPPCTSVAP